MEQKILEFLKKNRISVLGVTQPRGKIHSATLHFAHSENPLSFFFITEKASRKCRSLLDYKSHNASLVIGFSEKEFTTVQMEGKVKIVKKQTELETAWKTYSQKYPTRAKLETDPSMVILQFTPSWWSYRDLINGQTIISTK